MYRFIKNYTNGSTTVFAGVSLKNTILQNGLVSVEGSEVFKNMPLEYFEEFEPKKFKKEKPAPIKKRGRPKKK